MKIFASVAAYVLACGTPTFEPSIFGFSQRGKQKFVFYSSLVTSKRLDGLDNEEEEQQGKANGIEGESRWFKEKVLQALFTCQKKKLCNLTIALVVYFFQCMS